MASNITITVSPSNTTPTDFGNSQAGGTSSGQPASITLDASSLAALLKPQAGGNGGLGGAVLSQPALVTVPLAFATMVGVSLVTSRPLHVARTMVRLHTPEAVMVDRGAFRPRGAD